MTTDHDYHGLPVKVVRKRPIEIEVVEYDAESRDTISTWLEDEYGTQCRADPNGFHVYNTVDEQWLTIPVGHYVAIGVKGEVYPIAPDILAETYEEVLDLGTEELNAG